MMYSSKRSVWQCLFLALLSILSVVALLAPFTFLPFEKATHVDTGSGQSQGQDNKFVEVPLHRVKLPEFSAIRDVKQKKKAFFDFIRPAIEQENHFLLSLREQIQALQVKINSGNALTDPELLFFNELKKDYLINKKYTDEEQVAALLHRVDIVPIALVMVQAANESAWGTSRFAQIGLNFFGIWCFREGCGMIPRGRDSDGKHEVMAFKTVNASVKRYLYNINSNRAYSVFREIRHQLRTEKLPLYPDLLATGLIHYSERKGEYVVDILNMLKHNKSYFN